MFFLTKAFETRLAVSPVLSNENPSIDMALRTLLMPEAKLVNIFFSNNHD